MWFIRHLTTAFHFHLWQKKMAVFDMYMSICVHVRSRFTAPLITGFKVSKQKQKIVFGMDTLGWIPWYLARYLGQKKKKETRARVHTETDRQTDCLLHRHRYRDCSIDLATPSEYST